MFSHVMLGCSDRERSKKFYDATLGALGHRPGQADAWHAAGVANGGTAIEDPPGVREGGVGKLYLAYLRDPDGNKLCGYYRMPADQ